MGLAAGKVIGMFVIALRSGSWSPPLRELVYPNPMFVRGVKVALLKFG
jgi:hypothetical protein